MKELKAALFALLIAVFFVACAPLSEDFSEVEDRTEIVLNTGDGDDAEQKVPGGQ